MAGLIKKILLALVIAVFSIGFNAYAHSKADAMDAINAAKAALKKADSIGGAWRDTADMIKQAEALLEQDKNTEAAKLADEAKAQGMLGHEQAASQATGKLHF